MSAVCGLRFTDFRQVAFFVEAKISIQLIALDKATKESGDLSVCVCVYVFIHNISKSRGLNKISRLRSHSTSVCMCTAQLTRFLTVSTSLTEIQASCLLLS